jgi:hypothetical protein
MPKASAMTSIWMAGSLKMISPAATGGAKAIPIVMSSGSDFGLNAARSSQAPARASTQGL